MQAQPHLEVSGKLLEQKWNKPKTGQRQGWVKQNFYCFSKIYFKISIYLSF